MDLPFSHAEAAEDDGDGDGDGDGDDDDDGEGYIPHEEDEGRDSGGYYEDEEAEGEPYESQPTSDSGHSMPDLTADVGTQKSHMMSEEETKSVSVLEAKPVSVLEANIENKPGDPSSVQLNMQYETCSVDSVFTCR